VVSPLLRFRTVLVIGIDIGRADDPRSVNDEPSGHRQSPTALAVAHRGIVTEAEVDRSNPRDQRALAISRAHT